MTTPAQELRSGLSSRLTDMLEIASAAPQMTYGGVWYSWDAIRESAGAASAAVADLEPDAAIGVVCRNHPLVLGAVLGLLRDGRCVLPFPLHGSDDFVAREVTSLRPAAMIGLADDWARAGLARSAADHGVRRIEIGEDPSHRAGYSTVTQGSSGPRGVAYPAGTAFVLQTSGTTGTPKRVPVTYRNLDAAVGGMRQRARRAGAGADQPRLRTSVAILNTPVSHTSGMLAFCLNAVEGRRLALLDKFDPIPWAEYVHDHGIGSAGVPPAALAMLLDADIPASWLASLKMIRSGTAPLDPQLALRFEERFAVPVVQAYGATEFQGVTTWSFDDHQRFGATKRGSVGRPLPGVELRTTDPENGGVLGVDEEGRLEIRSAAASVTTPDGWVTTNDRARIDVDGFLWILGRLDDIINRGGLKVDSTAVAAVLRSHPLVAEAAVVGVPDPRLGEVPCAAVVLADADVPVDTSEIQEALRAHVRSELPPYMVPARFVVVPGLPLTANLKVDRPAVGALFA